MLLTGGMTSAMDIKLGNLNDVPERNGLKINSRRIALAGSELRHAKAKEIDFGSEKIVRSQRRDFLAIKETNSAKLDVLKILDGDGRLSLEMPIKKQWDVRIPKDAPIFWVLRNDEGDHYDSDGRYPRTAAYQFDFQGNERARLPKSKVGIIDNFGSFVRDDGELLLVHALDGSIRLTRISPTGKLLKSSPLRMAVREEIRFLLGGAVIAIRFFDPTSRKRWATIYSADGDVLFEIPAEVELDRVVAVTSDRRHVLLDRKRADGHSVEAVSISNPKRILFSLRTPFNVQDAAISPGLETIVLRSQPEYQAGEPRSEFLVIAADGTALAKLEEVRPWGESAGAIEIQGRRVHVLSGADRITLEVRDATTAP